MTNKEKYEAYCASKIQYQQETALSTYFVRQWERFVRPFPIFGPIYYVGDTWVCAHLIDTGDGLLLIDCGNTGGEELLIESIWEAGFSPRDIRWLILSHGHLDHFGACNFLKMLSGCEVYLAEPDARMLREQPEFSLIQESWDYGSELFEPDKVIQDGDVRTFGNITIEFKLVPGHTEGCVAMFFDVSDGVQTVRAGYYGGFGFNTLTKDFLQEYGKPEMREIYRQSIQSVMDEKVDLFLGNHCVNNDTLEKAALKEKGGDTNPFLDSHQWKEYLKKVLRDLDEFCDENPL